jgi:hypothetical protein
MNQGTKMHAQLKLIYYTVSQLYCLHCVEQWRQCSSETGLQCDTVACVSVSTHTGDLEDATDTVYTVHYAIDTKS